MIAFKNIILLLSIFPLITSYRLVLTNSISSLQLAITNSKAFDDIVLSKGLYNGCKLSVPTQASDIIIRSETDGGVIITGSVTISIAGTRITFRGFQFVNGTSPKHIISVTSSYSTFTQLNFYGFYAYKYLNMNAGTQYNLVSYCNFEAKPANAPPDNLLGVLLDGVRPAYHKIQYCSFRNLFGKGGDYGNEPIRLGLGVMSNFSSRTIVEFCVFDNTAMADSETISVKSEDNIIRYNTFTNQQGAMLVFRNGNNNYAYGNFFINAGGIRVKQASNIYIYNNYFQNSGLKGSGSNTIQMDDVSTYPNPGQYHQKVSVLYNTIVNGNGIDLGVNAKTNNIWSGNLFQVSTANVFIAGVIGSISFNENLYNGVLGIPIASGMTSTSTSALGLSINQENYYSLSSSSIARNAGTRKFIGTIPPVPEINADFSLSLDIAECSRPSSGSLDIGSNQFQCSGISTERNKPLKINEVGPSYKSSNQITNKKAEQKSHKET